MKPFAWSHEKNQQLLASPGRRFAAVIVAIEEGGLLDVRQHPNPQRYPGQRILIVRVRDYVHLVPFSETDNHLFLKTIIPSRKETRLQAPPTTSESSS